MAEFSAAKRNVLLQRDLANSETDADVESGAYPWPDIRRASGSAGAKAELALSRLTDPNAGPLIGTVTSRHRNTHAPQSGPAEPRRRMVSRIGRSGGRRKGRTIARRGALPLACSAAPVISSRTRNTGNMSRLGLIDAPPIAGEGEAYRLQWIRRGWPSVCSRIALALPPELVGFSRRERSRLAANLRLDGLLAAVFDRYTP
jgi:hypothetical protein